MSFEQEKTRQTNGLEQGESEEKGGMSLSPPAFSLTASGAGNPIQRQSAEGETTNAAPAAVTLTPEQITAARSQNTFLLGQNDAINALQTALGIAASGTFDDATLNAIATYQAGQNMTRRDGRMDRATLDGLVRVLVTANNFNGVAAIARDFFKLDEQATAVAVNYNAQQTANGAMVNGTVEFGPTAFTNGLTSLGAAVDAAMGAGTSIADQSWGVLEASTRTERQNAMWSNPNAEAEAGLAVWVREHFPTEEHIREYLNRTDIQPAEKTATLGKLAVELGRLEFLMGVIFHGGTDQSWESAGTNQGPFVNNFKSEVGNGVNTHPWCTMFSGYLRRMLGFNSQLSTRGPLIFNSGARLDSWATDNRNFISGTDDFDDPADYADYSGGSIDREQWATLITALTRSGITAEEKATEVDNFFSARITPQPGDIMVVNNSSTTNNYGSKSSSHTVNVESYSGHTVSTIEGNKGNKVTGTTYDFTDPADVRKIIIIARLGMEFFPHDDPQPAQEGAQDTTAHEGAAGGPPQPVQQAITEVELLRPLQAMVRELQLLAHRREYISSDAAGASVNTMAGNNSGGGDT